MILRNPTKQFFRWKEDICGFINEYWDLLWPEKIKSSTWENSVASALSMHPTIFKSGLETMKQNGWWSLRVHEPPIPVLKKSSGKQRNRSRISKPKPKETTNKDLSIKKPETPISRVSNEFEYDFLNSETDPEDMDKSDNDDDNDNVLLKLAKYIADQSDEESVFTAKLENVKRKKLQLVDGESEWNLLQRTERAKPCPLITRLKRKLILRRLKRTMGLKLFNIDNTIKKYVKSNTPVYPFESEEFQKNDKDFEDLEVHRYRLALSSKLFGYPEESIEQISPYTHRTLKQFIRRDFESEPMKLAVFRELAVKYNNFFPGRSNHFGKHPIDYCYFHPKFLNQVNRLLSQFFWPGIDISEALDYPDFSVVALYRKLIIGAGFMTPAGYITYFFVHPDWERAGVGTFMMYHLIQTCQGKDITLHVSASNPALILYQKFGFKPEQFIVNFYDKYYPENDKRASKNALFVRLRR